MRQAARTMQVAETGQDDRIDRRHRVVWGEQIGVAATGGATEHADRRYRGLVEHNRGDT
jgi:hypothetical protein